MVIKTIEIRFRPTYVEKQLIVKTHLQKKFSIEETQKYFKEKKHWKFGRTSLIKWIKEKSFIDEQVRQGINRKN